MKRLLRMIAKPHIWLAVIVMAAFSIPVGIHVSAAGSQNRSADFIIHADSISGDMLPPTLVIEGGKAYLRFQYADATIHGLTLTKVLHTGSGIMTVKIKAPSATATNMKVDVSAFTFGGACLKLGEPVPQAGLKDVTLAVHKQTAGELNLSGARIASLSGDKGQAPPSVPGLLAGLAGTTGNSLKQAVSQLMQGHVPLLQCTGTATGKSQQSKGLSSVTGAVGKTLPPVGQAEKTVKDITGGAGKTVTDAVNGTEKTIGKVSGDAGKILGDAGTGNVGALPGDVVQTVCDGADQIKQQLDQLSAKTEDINQQAEAILAGSGSDRKSLASLIEELKASKGKIDSLVKEPVSQDQLQALENQTKQLKTEEEKVRQLKDGVKSADYMSRLSRLQNQLNDVKGQLKQLDRASICSKDAYNELKTKIDATSSAISKGKTKASELQAGFSEADGLVNKMVAEIEKFVQATQATLGGGLLGGINDILNGLLGNIQNLLDAIKNETGNG